MKNLNIQLEDKEYNKIKKAKKDLTWREYLVQSAERCET